MEIIVKIKDVEQADRCNERRLQFVARLETVSDIDDLMKGYVPFFLVEYDQYYTYSRVMMDKVRKTNKPYLLECLAPFPDPNAICLECSPHGTYHLIHPDFKGVSDRTEGLELYNRCKGLKHLQYFLIPYSKLAELEEIL
jgi:hypothetical protein